MIPLSYVIRNILNHKVTSSLTIGGISLVVFVAAAVVMLVSGLRATLVETGSDDNAIVIRKASQTEVTSIIMRDQADIVSTYPEIATGADNLPMYTNELYVLINLKKRANEATSNVVVRGVTDHSMQLRPKVKLIEGRLWKPGTAEVICGKSASKRFEGCGLGETVRFGSRDWTIVGVFDAGGSAFDSEIWGDIDQMMDAFKRPVYSSLSFKLSDVGKFDALKERMEKDPRLPLEVKREKDYYAEQSKFTGIFVGFLGGFISVIFSIGAVIGAMITMYASVANRTKEIGTLRSLGFSRLSILVAFMQEAFALSLAGGVIGLVGASFLKFIEISTTNFNTFSELAFSFELNGLTVIISILFAVFMGFFGGLLPAIRPSGLRLSTRYAPPNSRNILRYLAIRL